MDPDGLPQPQRPATASPLVRVRWLVAVIAVMALLTAGWPLLNRTVSDSRLAAGQSLTIGPVGAMKARMTTGRGWRLMPAESNARQRYVLRAGPAQLTLATVSLPAGTTNASLWAGLRHLLRISHSRVTMGSMTAITSQTGRAGFSSRIAVGRNAGTVTVFVAPTGTLALEIVFLAPRDAIDQVVADTSRLARSVTFLTGPSLQGPSLQGPSQLGASLQGPSRRPARPQPDANQ
jgi:hypothetical protein